MRLQKVAGTCDDVNTCPAVYVEDDQVQAPASIDELTVIARGYQLDADTLAELPLPTGEVGARLPARDILAAADEIRRRYVIRP